MHRLQGSDDGRSGRVDAGPLSPLRQMIAAIELAASRLLAQRHRAVAAVIQPYLGIPDLLRDTPCPCSPDRYVRNLLHAGSDHTVLALVWRPGQMSPVHGHRAGRRLFSEGQILVCGQCANTSGAS